MLSNFAFLFFFMLFGGITIPNWKLPYEIESKMEHNYAIFYAFMLFSINIYL